MKISVMLICLALLLASLPNFANPLSTAIQGNDLKAVNAILAKDKAQVNVKTADGLPIFLAIDSGNIDILAVCIKAGANLESRVDYLCKTPLIVASSNGQLDMVEMLLEKGANPNARDSNGATALNLPSVGNDIMTMLLKKGGDLSLGDKLGVTPLMNAMRNADKDQVELLLSKGADFKHIDRLGNSMLHYATISQNFAMVMIALDHGCDAELANKNGDTPLHSMFGFGSDRIDEAKLKYAASSFGMNPQEFAERKLNKASIHLDSLPEKLQAAAKQELGEEIADDHIAICTLFLNRGVNINSLDEQGNSPLMGAVYIDNSELVKFLLAKGADIQLINEDGINLTQAAANSGNFELLQLLNAKGLSLNNIADDGKTLLHSAVYSANTAMISYLLDKGLEINALDCNDQSPIFFIFDNYTVSTLNNFNLLVAKGAKVNLQDISGVSLLEMAVIRDNEDIVEALLKDGADVNLKNYEDESPLDIATMYNAENVLPLLKKAAGIK